MSAILAAGGAPPHGAAVMIWRTPCMRNTAIANVYMLHAEALLCKHARDATDRGRARRWTSTEQEEYRLARERGVEAFTALKMAWKLRRLAGQELRAGIDGASGA